MLDPSTMIRLHDYSCKPAGEIEVGDKFYDKFGVIREVRGTERKESSPRILLETTDHRLFTVSEDQYFRLHSTLYYHLDKASGIKTPFVRYCKANSLTVREEGNYQVGNYIKAIQVPYSVPDFEPTTPAFVQAILDCMGQPLYLDPESKFRKKLSSFVKLKKTDRFCWWTFDSTPFDYTPFEVHISVFKAPLEYKLDYLRMVYFLCGHYTRRDFAYIGHPKESFVSSIRNLIHSLGGTTPDLLRPVKHFYLRSVSHFEPCEFYYSRLICKYVNDFVPGDLFKTYSNFVIGFCGRTPIEPGPVVSFWSDEDCHCITENHLALYCPYWGEDE